jgi:hypothetical protein
MKIDYQLEYKKQLQKNILSVRNEIDNPDFVLKITNHAEKYDRNYVEVKEKILTDDMYAEIFAKDPAKQNIYEKLAASYMESIDFVSNFKNLPNQSKMFVVNGQVTNKRQNDVKSIDFIFNIGEYNFYCSHKYIKATNGGAQDNQYNDIRNFLRNCNKTSSGNNYFIAICDGPYFDSKINIMNDEFGSNNVITLTIEDIETYLSKFTSL